MSPDIKHKHLILRIETNRPPTDVSFIEEWMKNLINKLGMELYSGPHVKYLDECGNRGLTGVCIIKTSHIALHVWDEPNPGVMQLDVYTCGQMQLADVVSELEIFRPLKIEYKFIDRAFQLYLMEKGTVLNDQSQF